VLATPSYLIGLRFWSGDGARLVGGASGGVQRGTGFVKAKYTCFWKTRHSKKSYISLHVCLFDEYIKVGICFLLTCMHLFTILLLSAAANASFLVSVYCFR
jgi:hypothetical protein